MKMEVRKEIRHVKKQGKVAKGPLTSSNVDQFQWHAFLEEMEQLAPALMAVLEGAVTAQQGKWDSSLISQ